MQSVRETQGNKLLQDVFRVFKTELSMVTL